MKKNIFKPKLKHLSNSKLLLLNKQKVSSLKKSLMTTFSEFFLVAFSRQNDKAFYVKMDIFLLNILHLQMFDACDERDLTPKRYWQKIGQNYNL